MCLEKFGKCRKKVNHIPNEGLREKVMSRVQEKYQREETVELEYVLGMYEVCK